MTKGTASGRDEGQENTRGPGARLRAAREAAKLSCEEVARRMHLDPAVISRLERDEYADLAPIYVSGYLRQYARLLNLPESEIAAASPRRDDYSPTVVSHLMKPQVRSHDPWMRWTTYGVVMVLLVLVGAWWYGNSGWTPGLLQDEDVATSPDERNGEGVKVVVEPVMPAPAEEPTASREEDPAEVAVATAESMDDSSGELVTTGMMAEQDSAPAPATPTPQGAVTATDSEQAPASDTPPAVESPSVILEAEPGSGNAVPAVAQPAPGDATVVLRLLDDCWIELTDATGKRLAFDLYRGGSTWTLHGRAPFSVLLGNARAVEIEYNGEPFDITRYRNKFGVAQFDLGAAGG